MTFVYVRVCRVCYVCVCGGWGVFSTAATSSDSNVTVRLDNAANPAQLTTTSVQVTFPKNLCHGSLRDACMILLLVKTRGRSGSAHSYMRILSRTRTMLMHTVRAEEM